MVYFKAFIFQGKRTARKALDTIEDNYPDTVWVDDIALLSRNKLGGLSIHSTWAQDDSDISGGIGWGAITGGMIGALLGPAGVVAGAMGGAGIGGLIGTGIDYQFDDPKLDDFAESLQKNTSALVLVGEMDVLDEFATALGDVDADIIDTELDEDDVKALRKALKK